MLFRSVTVLTQDSAAADVLSTAIFLMDIDKSRALVNSLDGVEAMWVMPNGEVIVTDGMKKVLRDLGDASYE